MKTFKIYVAASLMEDRVYEVEADSIQEALDKQAGGEFSYEVTHQEPASEHVYGWEDPDEC